MTYCPICGEELRSGTVCTCGWDPSRDYESYLSLMPAGFRKLSCSAQRRQHTQKLLDEQRKVYEAQIEALNKRQDAFEEQIKNLKEELLKERTDNAAKFTAMLKRIELLESVPRNIGTAQTQTVTKPSVIASKYHNLKKGDIIIFGKYWQGKSQSAGKTAIQWRVLAREGSKALLISKYGLDAKPYNAEYEPITWADSSLEKWLNREFCREAFSVEEQKSMICRTVSADANPKYKTDPGKPATDKVFLLSIQEAEKYFASDNDRRCALTAYALAQGAYQSSNYKTAEGEACCWWWLRSPGGRQDYAAAVYYDGSVRYRGYGVLSDLVCVRPALWINLES